MFSGEGRFAVPAKVTYDVEELRIVAGHDDDASIARTEKDYYVSVDDVMNRGGEEMKLRE